MHHQCDIGAADGAAGVRAAQLLDAGCPTAGRSDAAILPSLAVHAGAACSAGGVIACCTGPAAGGFALRTLLDRRRSGNDHRDALRVLSWTTAAILMVAATARAQVGDTTSRRDSTARPDSTAR